MTDNDSHSEPDRNSLADRIASRRSVLKGIGAAGLGGSAWAAVGDNEGEPIQAAAFSSALTQQYYRDKLVTAPASAFDPSQLKTGEVFWVTDTGEIGVKTDSGRESPPMGSSSNPLPSVQTGQLDVTDRWDFKPGYELPPQQVTDSTNYDNEPHLIRAPNDDLLLIYRNAGDHISNDGKIVYQRSTDWREATPYNDKPTWGTQTTIVDDASYDDRNQQVGVDYDAGRIVIHYRKYDAAGSTTIGQFFVTSDDSGLTWSSPTDISSNFSSVTHPFGHPVETSNGWMQLYFSTNNITGIFSTDKFQSWGSPTTVASTSGNANLTVAEPVPVVLPQPDGTRDNVLIMGRDTADSEQFHIKSTDGGSTWGSITQFDMQIGGHSVWPYQRGANEFGVVTADRDRRIIRHYTVSARYLWDNPDYIANMNYTAVFEGETAGNSAEFGYPTPLVVGPNHALLTWYSRDGSDTDTEVWVASANSGADTFRFMKPSNGQLELPNNIKFKDRIGSGKSQIISAGGGSDTMVFFDDDNNVDAVVIDESGINTLDAGVKWNIETIFDIDTPGGGQFILSPRDLTSYTGATGELANHDGTDGGNTNAEEPAVYDTYNAGEWTGLISGTIIT